ncbi:MAG: hypothetical protein AAF845_08355 [Bacteroidota bacterium]
MTTILRRIEPVSLAKVYAVVTGSLMLVFALPAGCGLALFGSMSGEMGGVGAGFGAGIGLVVALLYPIFGAVFGFIAGWLYGFVYNLVADRVGGVELELDTLGEVDIL